MSQFEVGAVNGGDGVPDRQKQRTIEHRSAQHLIRVLVDFLTASACADNPPRRIGDIAATVLARAGAMAAARKFIADCEDEHL